MDNWDDLRFVVALARCGSMANAARHLRTNTATVSRRIKRLNENANAALFLKGATEWELTEEGRRLYEMAAGFSDELEAFKAGAHEGAHSTQTIRVTGLEFLNTTILAPALKSFRTENPNITLELSATDRNVSLAYGETDIALRLTRPNAGRLMERRIAEIKMGVYSTKEADATNTATTEWIGLSYDLDWTPEMKNGVSFFSREPSFRMSSFAVILQAMSETG
ncbi:MAG: LysR family transcriptional regulator [Amylibacter sp.]